MLGFEHIELLGFAVLIAITANVFNTLTEDGMVLGWYGRLLDRMAFTEEGEEKKWIYLAKPLGWCDLCFGGQLALFFYLYWAEDYNVLIHIFFICLTIKIIEWLKN